NPDSMRLRFHCQTAAASLTRPQHQINIVRTSLQALAAVLGGAQSLHTNGMDEAFAIPTEEAMKIALRTQQIIADESGVPAVVDPSEKVDLELHPYDPSTATRQIARLHRVRRERDHAKVRALLEQLIAVAQDESANIMPTTIELVTAGATMGDIVETLKKLWGT